MPERKIELRLILDGNEEGTLCVDFMFDKTRDGVDFPYRCLALLLREAGIQAEGTRIVF